MSFFWWKIRNFSENRKRKNFLI